jgi:hypothetical protein
MDLYMMLKEAEGKETTDTPPEEVKEKQSILMAMAKFVANLGDDILDDDSYDAIEVAFDALFDVIISLEEEDLDSDSDEEFLELMDAFDSLESVEVDEAAYKYKRKKVGHGRKRSQAGKLTGSKKRDYIKKLKDNRKDYKRSASKRRDAKRKKKKYNKTAGAKQSKRMYKSMNK